VSSFTSPEKSDQIARRKAEGSRGGRPPAFDPERYADRNVVERCFNRLEQIRDLAWVPRTVSRRATCTYSQMRPPTRSRRIGRIAASERGGVALAGGC
jgi:transposase